VHHVGILYDQIMMHGQRNIKLWYGIENYGTTNVCVSYISGSKYG